MIQTALKNSLIEINRRISVPLNPIGYKMQTRPKGDVVEIVSIKGMSYDAKVLLLKELGYGVDEERFVVDAQRKRVMDKYAKIEIQAANAIIVPGSTLVLDDNPVSISSYMEEYKISL